MPEGDQELAERVFDALSRGGVDGVLPFVHEEFVMVTPPELASEPGAYTGHDGIRRWFESFYEAMDEVRLEPKRIEPHERGIVVWFRMIARGRTTGLELVQEAVALCTVRDGLLAQMQFFLSWEEAVGAAESQD